MRSEGFEGALKVVLPKTGRKLLETILEHSGGYC